MSKITKVTGLVFCERYFSLTASKHYPTGPEDFTIIKCFLLDVLLCWAAESEPGSQEDFDWSKVLRKEPNSRSSDVWDSTDKRPGLPEEIADAAAPKCGTATNQRNGNQCTEFAFPHSLFLPQILHM